MEGWKCDNLGNLFELISGATPATEIKDYWSGDIVWITPIDLNKISHIHINGSARMISKKGLDNCSAKLIPANSLVMSSRAPIGYLAISTIDYATNQGCKSLVLKDERKHSVYFHFFNLIFNMKKIKELGTGTTFMEVSKKDISEVEINFPESLTEQRKIAEILTTLDDAIQQSEQVIAKQKNIKAGLMHDLLTYGIDQNGNIRSPQTHSFVEKKGLLVPEQWEVEELGSVIVRITTGSANTQDKVQDGKYPLFVRSNTIEKSNKYIFDGEAVLTSGDGIGVGKIYHYHNGKFNFHQRVYCIYDFKESQLFGKYFFEYFKNNFYAEISKQSAKTTVDSVRMAMITEMLIKLPEFAEQRQIVSILEAQDELITAEENKLSKLLKTKQGLMHDLLTGKVRVENNDECLMING